MSEYRKGIIAAVVSVVIWSTTYVSTKILVEQFSAIQISIVRFAIGVVLLHILAPVKLKMPDWKCELRIMAAGFTGMFLYYFLENLATKHTYASNVSIIVTSIPFLTVLLAPLFYASERFKAKYAMSFLLAVGGFALILVTGQQLKGISWQGDALAMGAAFVFSLYTLILRGVTGGGGPMAVTRKAMTYGLFCIVLFALIHGDIRFPSNPLSPPYLWHFLFLGIMASGVCFSTWAYAVNHAGAIVSSQFIYLVPFITILLSSFILSERITLWRIAGLALILSGVVISQVDAGTLMRKKSAVG
ncbi:MAG: DMT family transporter [Spirochaetales bacterium]|nr:DMT family transporter [Spirochaetales bacterium]